MFETSYGADLSEVRIHDNPQAAGSAARLNARAFSLGTCIAFGAGEYQPHTASGRHLLGHELAHVAQGHGGIRRQTGPSMTPVDANASFAPPAEALQSSMAGPAHVEHATDFNPCAVDVRALTNYQLLAEYSHALSVVNRGRGADGYFDYRNLQRRLIAERDRRVDLGHAWLATMPSALPEQLYHIVDGEAGSFQVVAVPGTLAAGAPDRGALPLMTRDQFDRFLLTHNVERVNAHTFQLRMFGSAPESGGLGSTMAAGGLYNRPVDMLRLFSPPAFPAETPLVCGGALASPFDRPDWFLRQPAYMQLDLMLNPPALDPARAEAMRRLLGNYRRAPGVPARIDPIGSSEAVRGGTAAVAQTDIPGLAGRNFVGASAEALPPALRGTPGTTGGSVLVAANPTAVNHAEHVALENLRLAIEDMLRRGVLTRENLRGRTVFVMVEQEPCPSCAAGAGEGRAGVLQQFAELYPELTVEVRNARTTRAFLYRGGELLNPLSGVMPEGALAPTTEGGPRGLTAAQLEPLVTPELRRSLAVGDFRAGGGATLTGAGIGAGVAVLANGVVILLNPSAHPDWGRELATSGGLGGAGGGTGALTEQLLISSLNRSMLSDISATGASRLTPGLITGAGRFGGGSVGAMFVEGISMGLLEEREHSALEVGTRMTRSAALGGGSVWAGAAAGTAVGGPVGFIVGLLVGGALYYVGDKLVPGGREDWDAHEAGCTPLPTASPWTGSAPGGFNSVIFNCFEAETPVRLADGSERRIAEIAIGDAVLSYNERLQRLETCLVSAVHQAAPALMLRLQLDNAAPVQVTPAHKLRGPHGWIPAGDLRPGDILWIASSAERVPAVVGARLQAVTVAAPAGAVYDLSVTGTHTYFAGGILAHNKLP